MSNITINIIATGKYVNYLSNLLKSIENKFLPNHHKKIFVFSNILSKGWNFVNELPTPLNALLKPFYINRISKELISFDYIYVIDSDCLVYDTIDEEIFPEDNSLVIPIHPLRREWENPFEENPKSVSYVKDWCGKTYYQSCFFGAKADVILSLLRRMEADTSIDLKNRIISKWYDESYINKYLIDFPVKELHGGYAYPDPERWKINWPFVPKIIHYNKSSQ